MHASVDVLVEVRKQRSEAKQPLKVPIVRRGHRRRRRARWRRSSTRSSADLRCGDAQSTTIERETALARAVASRSSLAQRPTPLDAGDYRDLVRRALAEDIGGGDVTTDAIVRPARSRARHVPGQVALRRSPASTSRSRPSAQLDPAVDGDAASRDGDECAPATTIAEVTGSARALLTGERTALNFLQRLSGIATLARAVRRRRRRRASRARHPQDHADAARAREVRRARRRRDQPSHRARRRRADQGQPHPSGGGVAQRRRRRCARIGPRLPIEVEAQRLDEVDEALEAGADIVLLDNMSIDDIREAVRRSRGRAKTEISGGVTLERMPSSPRPAPTSSRSAR